MPTPTLIGRSAPVADDAAVPPPYLAQSETAQEHVRNAIMILREAERGGRDGSPVVILTAGECEAIERRLLVAIKELERVA